MLLIAIPLLSPQALILQLPYTPGSGTNSTMPGVTTADIVGWVVFSLSTFLAIVTAVIVVAVVACLKKRNRRTATGVFIVLNSFPSLIELQQYIIEPTDPTIGWWVYKYAHSLFLLVCCICSCRYCGSATKVAAEKHLALPLHACINLSYRKQISLQSEPVVIFYTIILLAELIWYSSEICVC